MSAGHDVVKWNPFDFRDILQDSFMIMYKYCFSQSLHAQTSMNETQVKCNIFSANNSKIARTYV